MRRITQFVGMDVHKDSIAIALADGDGKVEQLIATIPNDWNALWRKLKGLGSKESLAVCYEAGPTGFGLCRRLSKAGIVCMVAAPSLIPSRSGDRVKTDRRDALNLARLFRSGLLTPVHVPEEATEAMRDLERAREDAKNAERAARHQLGKFLLRHDRIYREGNSWTQKHLAWISGQKFAHEAQQRVLTDYLHAVQEAGEREARLRRDIEELAQTWRLALLVRALMGFRGIRLVTAVTICAELDDLLRFGSPRHLMAYLGLVPSEHSSGDRTRRGSITKAGNGHVRRMLVESAWAYRHRPLLSREIGKRNEGLSPGQRAIAWKAQVRLHKRYRQLRSKGKNGPQTVTAVARELAGFIWAMARQVESEELASA